VRQRSERGPRSARRQQAIQPAGLQCGVVFGYRPLEDVPGHLHQLRQGWKRVGPIERAAGLLQVRVGRQEASLPRVVPNGLVEDGKGAQGIRECGDSIGAEHPTSAFIDEAGAVFLHQDRGSRDVIQPRIRPQQRVVQRTTVLQMARNRAGQWPAPAAKAARKPSPRLRPSCAAAERRARA
jgi:hypothetical protein